MQGLVSFLIRPPLPLLFVPTCIPEVLKHKTQYPFPLPSPLKSYFLGEARYVDDAVVAVCNGSQVSMDFMGVWRLRVAS